MIHLNVLKSFQTPTIQGFEMAKAKHDTEEHSQLIPPPQYYLFIFKPSPAASQNNI